MPDGTFARPELTTFTRLDEHGLRVTGQRLEPDRTVLACTIAAKEVVIIHGRNIYPQDVEHSIRAELRELASLSGAAFAVSDDAGRDAMVVLHEVRGRRDGEALQGLTMSIQQLVARNFGVVPSEVHLLRPGAVRKSTSGKVQRTTMRELHLAQQLVPVASWSRPVGSVR